MKNFFQAKQSRRALIAKAAASAVCVLVGPAIAFADQAKLSTDAGKSGAQGADLLAQMDENFARNYVGTNFEFVSETGRARAVLRGVDNSEVKIKRANFINVYAFFMRFEIIESTKTAPEGYCYVAHPALGAFDLMVVPGTGSMGERTLIATFVRS